MQVQRSWIQAELEQRRDALSQQFAKEKKQLRLLARIWLASMLITIVFATVSGIYAAAQNPSFSNERSFVPLVIVALLLGLAYWSMYVAMKKGNRVFPVLILVSNVISMVSVIRSFYISALNGAQERNVFGLVLSLVLGGAVCALMFFVLENKYSRALSAEKARIKQQYKPL